MSAINEASALALIGRLAAAPSQPAPQSTRDRLQQRCSDWGVYWRASDAHGVDLSHEQAVELLQDALGVEVEIAPQPLPDAPAKHLRLDVSKEWCERMGKIEQDAGHPDVSVGPSAQPLPGAAQPTYPACKGTNCGATDGWSHSPECVAEHDAACLGAQPAEAQAVAWIRQHPDGTLTDELLPEWQIERTRRESGAWIPLGRIGAQPVREAEPAPKREPLSAAATDVLAERQRQISVEGWTPEHDDEHDSAEMAQAAACYALAAAEQRMTWPWDTLWPWSMAWWKPTNPRRDLIKAGALILAEIERLDRAATGEKGA